MIEEPRIGVYICHCGVNIGGVINIRELVDYVKTLPNVVEVKDYIFMCSAPGQELVREGVRKNNLNRVIVAACSPTMHEHTFRTALAEAGLNPYVFEMANIRELCSWPHSDIKELANEKAKTIIRMAVAKASLLEPLEEIKFKVNRDALILGGGVSGLAAARDLAGKGFTVYLIEKTPTLGGRAARLGKLSYIDMRGSDIARELIQNVTENPLIKIYVNTELIGVDGSVGNFKVKLVKKPRYVNWKCTLCGECVKVCPVEVSNEYELGISKRKAIYYPFKDAYPNLYVIDVQSCTRCGRCVEVCPVNAINLDEEIEEINLDVGAIIAAVGYEPYDPPTGEYGYRLSNRIITLFQLERLLDRDGPTNGELKIDGFKPRNIVFIMCVGSLNTTTGSYPYCSRMCCSSTIKNALMIREAYPEVDIYILHKDIRTYGRKDEQLYMKAGEQFIRFARFRDPPKVLIGDHGRIDVKFYEETIQDEVTIPADLVVLAVGVKPTSDIDKVRKILKVGCGPEGFLKEAHLKLRPVEATTDGVFLAGAVTGPKNIIESVASGSAAASKAVTLLSKEEVIVEPTIAVVNKSICSGCSICIGVCPYTAISLEVIDRVRSAKVDASLCKGCGVCVAACPSGAMQQLSFKDIQLKAQLLAALAR